MKVKQKISKSLGYNTELNKKVLQMWQSWNEVDHMLMTTKTKGSKK